MSNNEMIDQIEEANRRCDAFIGKLAAALNEDESPEIALKKLAQVVGRTEESIRDGMLYGTLKIGIIYKKDGKGSRMVFVNKAMVWQYYTNYTPKYA